ncbi:coiled-coil domain-containing protein 60 isoform X2 [Rhineura floridana]|uniref:coiled-coil domain-containing protein 60 isoform X2 n=1 Tax=Rhineura floridana TaxID=261503 RepID=UPI002AC8755B|nr:coiled-coil domain-containing protein 60 isoform X2 [Rhineura floridana]
MPMHPKSDPRYFVVIRPLPIPNQKGLKVQARSNTIYNCWDVTREQVFRENYHRRIKQLTQQGYFTPSWKPYQDFGEPLYLDPRKLTLYGLGQLPLEFFREDVCPEEITEPAEPKAAKKSKQKDHEKKPLPFRHLEKDLRTLHRDLVHTRCLINSVKIGRGYFHTLHRETLERKNALMLEERKEEERWKTEFQPPRYPSSSSSDEGSSDDEELTDFFLTECPFLRETEKKKKKKIVRPFTPVYNGLLAEKHPDAHFESIFRQLCALNWLLEALTLEPNSSMKPVITCWNPKDYGGGKSSLKVITKEKTVKTRWEHFLLQTKGRKYTQKAQYRTAASKKTPKRSSTMSISSPHSKTTLTSTSSLTPVSDEAAQPPSDSAKEVEEMESSYSKQTKEEEEQPMSYYLQTLLQMIHEDVAKNFSKENMFWNSKYPRSHTMLTRRDLESDLSFGQKGKSSASSSKDDKTSMGAMREETPGEQRPKSSLAVTLREDKTVTATYSDEDSTEQSSRPQSSFIKRKEQLYNEMKEVFHEVAHESAFRLHDQLDILERRREEKSIQKYLCLRRITKFRRDLERMRQSIRSIEPAQDAESENWFSTLLARIPDDIKRDHRTQKVLKKLERFARNPDLRIRPPTFLKVLGELRIWEICSPDICAAVEFLREFIVEMPEEDYKQWLQSRVPIPKRAHSAPPIC